MSKGDIYTQRVDTTDINKFIVKEALISSNNYLHDKWASDKDRMYTKIYFAISLALTIIASIFISWISILILLNILTIFLILSAKTHNKIKKRFFQNRQIKKKSFREWGLEWRD